MAAVASSKTILLITYHFKMFSIFLIFIDILWSVAPPLFAQIQLDGRALRGFVARDATPTHRQPQNRGAALCTHQSDEWRAQVCIYFLIPFLFFLYSIIASATIFLAYLFFSFPGFPLTFYYIWNFLDNFYMEIVLKKYTVDWTYKLYD